MAKDQITFWRLSRYPGIEFLRASYVGHSYAPHIHRGYGIGVVEEGVEEFEYLGRTYSASGRSLITVNPNQIHNGHGRGALGWTPRMAYIDASYFRELSPGTRNEDVSPPWFPEGVVHDDELTELFIAMHRATEKSESDSTTDSLLQEFVRTLTERHASWSAGNEKAGEREAVMRAKAFIHSHFDSSVSLHTIAGHSFLSPSHLSRVFRRETGFSLHNYLNFVRVDRARALLRTGFSPAAVSYKTGFTDQSHLTFWFKRITGVTPAVYRSAYN